MVSQSLAAVVLKGLHVKFPAYIRILPGTSAEALAKIHDAGFETRELDFTQPIEAKFGDVFCLEVEAITEEQVPILDELARIGVERRAFVILPFSIGKSRPDSRVRITPTAKLRKLFEPTTAALKETEKKSPYFLEYQSVEWSDLDADEVRRSIIKAHSENGGQNIRQFCFQVFGSLFAFLNGIVFGVISPLPVFALLIASQWGIDVKAWWPLVWFLAGPPICMALAVGMNFQMQFKLAVAIWFAAEHLAGGGPLWEVIVPTIAGMATFYLGNRIHYTVDLRDLLTCLFDREIGHLNPEFHSPEKRPSVGSGEFILWRLEFPVWRLFSTNNLSRVFVSHRNSTDGIAIAKALHDGLVKTGNWSVYLDREHLSGGLWREQLADGYRGRGVVLCVLTPDDRERLRWVRRELYAACMLYRAYGYPVPVIVQAGLTLDDLLAYEEAHDRNDTPIHKVRERLVCVDWNVFRDERYFFDELEKEIKLAVARESLKRTPLILSRGLTAVAAQLVEMSGLVVLLAAFGVGSQSESFRIVLMLACCALATDFGGASVYRLLPKWAGGTRLGNSWMQPMSRRLRSPLVFFMLWVLAAFAIFWRNFDSALLVSLLVGFCLNMIDHELWQAKRLADSVLRPHCLRFQGIDHE